jgi:pimeloyl-ACP methyl ester carboxylesterase
MSLLGRALQPLLREARAPIEIASFLLRSARLHDLPRGDGHTVMFLPAFTLDDREFQPMAKAVARLGYDTQGWGEGRNLGLSRRRLDHLAQRVAQLADGSGHTVSLVGWSGGGLYAREIARRQPQAVRRVILLASPIHLAAAAPVYVDRSRRVLNAMTEIAGRPSFEPDPAPPPVPVTAIHSKRDGVVDWRAAMEQEAPQVENLEVSSSHLGLGYSLEVLRIIAERLARPIAVS